MMESFVAGRERVVSSLMGAKEEVVLAIMLDFSLSEERDSFLYGKSTVDPSSRLLSALGCFALGSFALDSFALGCFALGSFALGFAGTGFATDFSGEGEAVDYSAIVIVLKVRLDVMFKLMSIWVDRCSAESARHQCDRVLLI